MSDLILDDAQQMLADSVRKYVEAATAIPCDGLR